MSTMLGMGILGDTVGNIMVGGTLPGSMGHSDWHTYFVGHYVCV